MFLLVIGASASGKSEYAENAAVALGKKRLYLATMQPFGEEAAARICRHRALRHGKGFDSTDCYVDIGTANTAGYDTVLLECMSNLLANEMYREGACLSRLTEKLESDMKDLRKKIRHLVVVTNDVALDGLDYGEETNRYIDKMGEINRKLAAEADAVVEVVCSIPLLHKGAQTWG